ncbi:hypothetical protein PAXRUDRAFT_832623 [Paxillus rubicundulus Ve08.2h10]|uniref:Uncharacterized protein n=1 Tax=Paxillus rubicundulus Ve08.2h10 TaxID=930991 RepID=A0A0D0DJG8_9AGAM|nr:hypothetical protein PAXRUDRAFT_832623 [Paxillus rubicundulus Ve08.2h10]
MVLRELLCGVVTSKKAEPSKILGEVTKHLNLKLSVKQKVTQSNEVQEKTCSST